MTNGRDVVLVGHRDISPSVTENQRNMNFHLIARISSEKYQIIFVFAILLFCLIPLQLDIHWFNYSLRKTNHRLARKKNVDRLTGNWRTISPTVPCCSCWIWYRESTFWVRLSWDIVPRRTSASLCAGAWATMLTSSPKSRKAFVVF